MFSDLMDLGDDHRPVGTLCPDMKLTLERPDPDVVTAWTGRVNTVNARTDRVDVDALLIRPDGCVARALPTGQGLDSTTPRCMRWAPGSANRPEHRINSRLRFARYEVGVQTSDVTRM
ncbi:hypothetical protein OHS59_00665 [Streptomyces sp. NBC_00414]|uniref:aromatic-ring hydroxylase C-terminal domain-containing protein n=1 Tax=Streptomyces sp. NBC_00414 TaxID=2975739 RepID=UPI002E226CD3